VWDHGRRLILKKAEKSGDKGTKFEGKYCRGEMVLGKSEGILGR
jgi:hypothetical protein